MSFTIRIPDADFGDYFMNTGYPDGVDLVNLFVFGGGATLSAKNNAGGANATIIGAPLYHPNYVTVDHLNFIETSNEISDNNSTLIIAVRHLTANHFSAGTYTEYSKPGTLLYCNFPTENTVSINGAVSIPPNPNLETGIQSNAPVDSDFNFYAITQKAGTVTVYAIVNGVVTQSSMDVISQHTGKVRFGGWSLVGVKNTHDIAMAGIYKKGLDAAQLEAFYTRAKVLLAGRGITLK